MEHNGRHWQRVVGLLLAVGGLLGLTAARPLGNTWQVGSIVDLCQGTQIRQAPGLNECYHTIVPENEWKVRVIGGPRTTSDGLQWYDTSRAAAGDPSGGTGWVHPQQADSCPAVAEGTARPCPGSQAERVSSSIPGGQIVVPPPPPVCGDRLLDQVRCWWDRQSWPIKGLILLVAVIGLVGLTSRRSWGTYLLVGALQAVLLGLILWWLMDLARPIWGPAWHPYPDSPAGGDLAVLVGLLPLVA